MGDTKNKTSYTSTGGTRTEQSKVYNWEKDTWETKESKVKVAPQSSSGGMSESEIKNQADSILDSSNTSKSTKKSNKKQSETEIRTLEGDLVLRPNTKTIKIRVGETIKLMGIGPYLSGLYYVSEIKRTLTSSGYSNSFRVLKTNISGDNVKEVTSKDVISSNMIKR